MIRIIAIGKIKEKSMQAMINEYEKRLKPVHDVRCLELQNSNKTSVQEIKDDESFRIMEKLDAKDYVVLLERQGKEFSSEQLSQKVIANLETGKPVTFIIGGSHGVNESVKQRADLQWRFSQLTFPHQLMRVMLYEQIYRLFMIAVNHPYHK